MPGNDAGVTPSEVYERSSKALDSLSNVWNVSASVIKAITEVTDNSLRSEPDYQTVQHVKREHDQVVASLKTEFEWLEQHIPSFSDTDDSASGEKQMRIDALQQEQEELRLPEEADSENDEEFRNAEVADTSTNFQPAAIVCDEVKEVDSLDIGDANNEQKQTERRVEESHKAIYAFQRETAQRSDVARPEKGNIDEEHKH
ncbi:hypothetical protein NQZ79_g6966 [Umbelopsis isabellina]|nr:hypothetical protein NQZ79_g6966 [Umbelopsis isabellina]